MEDRPFEPMLIAGNSQVNIWERLYANIPDYYLPRLLELISR